MLSTGKYTLDSYSTQNLSNSNMMQTSTCLSQTNTSSTTSIAMVKSNGTIAQVAVAVSNSEADSGRASMASNNEQDQCSPTFQQKAFILNRCKLKNMNCFIWLIITYVFFLIQDLTNEQHQHHKMACKLQINQHSPKFKTQEMHTNQTKICNNNLSKLTSELLNPQNSLGN